MTNIVQSKNPYARTQLDPNHNWKPAKTGIETEHVVNPGDHPEAIKPAPCASSKEPSGTVVTALGSVVVSPDQS